MKLCEYCGRESDEASANCAECGSEFRAERAVVAEHSDAAVQPEIFNPEDVPGAFSFEEGFSRPDWKVIAKAIEKFGDFESKRLAWDEAVMQWMSTLAEELGGDCQALKMGRCVLVSNLEPDRAKRLLGFVELAIIKIKETLPGIAWRNFEGLHVVLLFSEDDDYFQYLSWFYPEGNHPASSGICIHRGFPHIACLYSGESSGAKTIAHELMHHSIDHLTVPRWLHEGLAMAIEGLVDPTARRQILSDDLPERHHRFWNEDSIQRFWAGTSFGEPGEPVELSYSLAEILFHLLEKKPEDFLAFIEQADYDDSGQTAALDCLGTCLGGSSGYVSGAGQLASATQSDQGVLGRGSEESGECGRGREVCR